MKQRILPGLCASLALGGCFDPSPGIDLATDGMTDETGDTEGGPSASSESGGLDDMPSTTDDAGGVDESSGSDGGAEMGTGGSTTSDPMDDDEDIDLFDSFEQNLNAWSFSDDADATFDAPSQWAYVAGDLVQTSAIAGLDDVVPARGTSAIGGDPDWDQYSVELAYTIDDDGTVGVACHVLGPDDWTRLDLDHETGALRLLRSVAGQVTVLAQASAITPPVALDIERTLSLQCGAMYSGSLDDALLVEAEADLDAEGSVGMFTSDVGDGLAGARFHWISVSDD